MNDEFDGRLKRRLSALDAAAPVAVPDLHNSSGGRHSHRVGGLGLSGSLPLGLAAAIAIAIGVAVASGLARQAPGAAVSAGPSMVIENAQASLVGDHVSVAATITNPTGQDDKLIGVSSPAATTAGLYDLSMCSTPVPVDTTTGLCGMLPIHWWLIKAHETVQLRGEIVLVGLIHPLAVGQSVEVTFEFATAPSVTVKVPVVAAPANP